MGFRSLWIGREEARRDPDRAKITAWLKEKGEFARERRSLRLADQDAVNRVRDIYGPVVRELVAAERAQVLARGL